MLVIDVMISVCKNTKKLVKTMLLSCFFRNFAPKV